MNVLQDLLLLDEGSGLLQVICMSSLLTGLLKSSNVRKVICDFSQVLTKQAEKTTSGASTNVAHLLYITFYSSHFHSS